jgi:hypothetical protein
MPETPEKIEAGYFVRFEPLRLWALVEYRDGSRYLEGVVRDAEWESEPGGAEFPEGERGPRDAVGYTAPSESGDPALQAEWESIIHARYRGKRTPASRHLPVPQYERDARIPSTA